MQSPHAASRQATSALYGLACLLLAGPTACSSDDLAFPGEGVPAELQILSGNNQTGTVGTLLPDSISVLVLDSKGRAVVGERVAFVASGSAAGAGLMPDTAVTDGSGRAVSYWQLGTTAGDQVIQAQVVSGSGTPQLTLDITASAMPGQPSQMIQVSGQNQVAQVATALPDSLVVLIEDQFGNPVGDVIVDWVAEVGGSVSSPSLATGSDGRSAVQRILGNKPGAYPTTATAAGLEGSPVEFTATGTVGPPAVLTIVTQPSSTATSGVPFARQPSVQITDPFGNPIQLAGVDVTAAVASGTGSLGGTTIRTTNAAGVASFSDLLISGVAGVRTLIFFASGYASATSNPIDVANTTPGSIAANAGDNQTAQVATNVSVNPSVIVRDLAGSPMQGITVTFAVLAGGGSISGGASKTTNGSGIATVSGWTLGQTIGTNTLRASVQASGVPGNPVSFTATAVPGPVSKSRSTISAQPATIAASTGSNETVITVVARDAFDNLIPGVSVTLTATGSGNRLTQPAGPTGANGQATGKLSSTVAGTKRVGAAIKGTTITQTANVTVGPGPADPQQSTASVPNGQIFKTTTITVQAADAFGNLLGQGGDAVTVNVTGTNPFGPLTVIDNGDGTYKTAYTPIFPGNDFLIITVNGSPLKNSPFRSQVSP